MARLFDKHGGFRWLHGVSGVPRNAPCGGAEEGVTRLTSLTLLTAGGVLA